MKSLHAEHLARHTDPDTLTIDDGIDPQRRPALVGQARAARAIRYALSVDLPGYNLFVTGPSGIGKSRFVRDAIAARARQSSVCDWVYVNNFARADEPLALALPPGRGVALREAMRRLVAELRTSLSAAFEADRYTQRMKSIRETIEAHRAESFDGLQREAEPQGLAIVQSDDGFGIAPMVEGKLLDAQEVAALPAAEQEQLRARIKVLAATLQQVQREGLVYQREQLARAREVNRETAAATVQPLMREVLDRHADNEPVRAWLESVRDDLLAHYTDFLPGRDAADERERDDTDVSAGTGAGMADDHTGDEWRTRSLTRFDVNVIMAAQAGRVPVVQVDHPTVPELLGRIEYTTRMGTVHTDFRRIKPGRLHEANGGYLLIDAWRLFTEPYAWDALKRALQRRAIRIESLAEAAGNVIHAQLDPAPIPLDVKVILFAERYASELLSEHDPDFDALFRVIADFDDSLERSPAHESGLAQVLLEQTCQHGLLPMGRAALAALVDEAVRRAEDRSRLSAQVQLLTEVAVEADFEAREQQANRIAPEHVALALASRRERAARLHDEHRRSILAGSLLIDTTGEVIGQVNALAVFDVGSESFGHPSRITATTRLGEGNVLDVQRETHMGGAIHTKGVMILSSYLAARYAPRHALPINATLVFEQSYGPIDGDSASVAEFCALLSALASIPIRQDRAITGSMNQLGEVQAIGGANHKIEGFHEICVARGLTGEQGVIMPASNVEHLMLSAPVLESVRAGRFHVWAVSTVDEAIELLMGVPAGGANDTIAQNSVSGRVHQRLTDLLAQRGSSRAAARRARYANGERD